MSIYKKLSDAKAEIGKISKDHTNPFFNSKYFDINSLLEHVEPILDKHGLMVLQPIVEGNVCSMIVDVENGEDITSSMPLPQLNDPQKMGSVVTYYRRYTLQSLLALQAEDDDGNKASGNVVKKEDDNKPWLNSTGKDKKTPTPEWSNVLHGIADGKIKSLNDVRKYYKVSKTTASEIEKALNS